jgi:hypothetical protein
MANNVSDAELRRAIAWGRAAFVAIAIVGFVCSSDFPPKKDGSPRGTLRTDYRALQRLGVQTMRAGGSSPRLTAASTGLRP